MLVGNDSPCMTRSTFKEESLIVGAPSAILFPIKVTKLTITATIEIVFVHLIWLIISFCNTFILLVYCSIGATKSDVIQSIM
jgi:hypothetical protein